MCSSIRPRQDGGMTIREEKAATELGEADLRSLYRDLLQRHGPQGWWWPGREPFEIAVGAVLVQRSRWEQAAVSIANLRCAGLLDPAALAAADEETVRPLVRPSGFPTAKPRRLLSLARWVEDRAGAVARLG